MSFMGGDFDRRRNDDPAICSRVGAEGPYSRETGDEPGEDRQPRWTSDLAGYSGMRRRHLIFDVL